MGHHSLCGTLVVGREFEVGHNSPAWLLGEGEGYGVRGEVNEEVNASLLATLIARHGNRHGGIPLLRGATCGLRECAPLLGGGVLGLDAPRRGGVDIYPLRLLHPRYAVVVGKLGSRPPAVVGLATNCYTEQKQK